MHFNKLIQVLWHLSDVWDFKFVHYSSRQALQINMLPSTQDGQHFFGHIITIMICTQDGLHFFGHINTFMIFMINMHTRVNELCHNVTDWYAVAHYDMEGCVSIRVDLVWISPAFQK